MILAILQARMRSRRLPGKVLAPLVDPTLIDVCLAQHAAAGADDTSNTPDTYAYPKGLDVEIVSASALRRPDLAHFGGHRRI